MRPAPCAQAAGAARAAWPLDRRRPALLAALCAAALVLAWNTQQRVKALEAELVKRQQDSGARPPRRARWRAGRGQCARRRGQDGAAGGARGRGALQRSQLEELIQSLSRSRDENVLADVEAAIRVACSKAPSPAAPSRWCMTLRRPTSGWRASASRGWSACAAPSRRTWSARARRR
jgi:uroporphyrin-III C-methyltransferase